MGVRQLLALIIVLGATYAVTKRLCPEFSLRGAVEAFRRSRSIRWVCVGAVLVTGGAIMLLYASIPPTWDEYATDIFKRIDTEKTAKGEFLAIHFSALEFSPNSRYLAVYAASLDFPDTWNSPNRAPPVWAILLWDLHNREDIWLPLHGPLGDAHKLDVEFSPASDKLIVRGGGNTEEFSLDASEARTIQEPTRGRHRRLTVDVEQKKKWSSRIPLISNVFRDRTYHITHIMVEEDASEIARMTVNKRITAAALSPDGTLVATEDSGGIFTIWEVPKEKNAQ